MLFCRNVVRKQPVSCIPAESNENHGTARNPVTTPPECFVEDDVFLKTMALCIDTYCPLTENPSMSLIENYWASHLGTGMLGNYQFTPAMSYVDALMAAREDESNVSQNSSSKSSGHHTKRSTLSRRHGSHDASTNEGLVTFNVSSSLSFAAGGTNPFNETSFISPEDWQLQYNYMYDFETNEAGHSTMAIIVAIFAIFLPVILSPVRFFPALTKSRGWTYWKSLLVYPAAFKRHREPVLVGNIPNRGQA